MSGTVTIGAAGAITAQTSNESAGLTFTKTAAKTARYDFLSYRPWDRLVVNANIVGPTDAAFGNVAANMVQARNVLPLATDTQGQLQGILASTGADTDFASGTVIHYTIHAFGL